VTRVRTVFIGSGGFGVPSLRALAAHESIDLVGIVTAPPRPVGRRQVLTPTPVGAAADRSLAILTPERLRAPESLAGVLALRPELAVLADYGQIVPAPLLELRHGALNLHPSLLPRHRGATPIPATIIEGDRETGVTLFRMDDGLDTGPIVAQSALELAGTETAPELEGELAAQAATLLTGSLAPYLTGELRPRPQPAEGATLTRPLHREHGRLDPTVSADALERRVRAYDPWPGAFVETVNGRLAVLHARTAPSLHGDLPGTLLAHGDGLALATADGRLELVRVQPAGGRPMDAAAYVRGRPGILGTRSLPR
jgi:methionyl-tRNA formyltransferase